MKLADSELYDAIINKISKCLSIIRPDQKFVQKGHRSEQNKYLLNDKRP